MLFWSGSLHYVQELQLSQGQCHTLCLSAMSSEEAHAVQWQCGCNGCNALLAFHMGML